MAEKHTLEDLKHDIESHSEDAPVHMVHLRDLLSILLKDHEREPLLAHETKAEKAAEAKAEKAQDEKEAKAEAKADKAK